MGIKCSDLDYAVECDSYNEMRNDIIARGGEIFLEKPEFMTIRARMGKQCADYVCCRIDGFYNDARHPSSVKIGNLHSDQSRRDFTINSMAQDEDDNIIDPFGGLNDIKRKVIRCVGNTADRLDEDALRMLRAMRFSITKGFSLSMEIKTYMWTSAHMLINVSYERIREELHKCFQFDTLQTLKVLEEFDLIRDYVFSETNLWLRPTAESH